MGKADGIKRTRCPKCGGEIWVSELCQYTKDFKVKKDGVLSLNFKRYDNGPIDSSLAYCKGCSVNWDADEFLIDGDGMFWDFKYE